MTSLISNAPLASFYHGQEHHPDTTFNNLVLESHGSLKLTSNSKKDISPPPYRAPVLDPHQNSEKASRVAISNQKVFEF